MSKFSFLPRQRFSAVVRSAAACAMLASTLAAVPAIAADNWPNGPLTVIAPFSPGGGGDTLVRLYGHQLSGVLNTTVIVENKPGAGGNIGTAVASRAEANGNTLVYGTNGTMGTNHALYRQPGYTLDDFDPIALFGKISLVFTVSSDSPFNSVNDIVTHAKANPVMAMAARRTVASVRTVKNLGELDPETIVTPGVFVQSICQVDYSFTRPGGI